RAVDVGLEGVLRTAREDVRVDAREQVDGDAEPEADEQEQSKRAAPTFSGHEICTSTLRPSGRAALRRHLVGDEPAAGVQAEHGLAAKNHRVAALELAERVGVLEEGGERRLTRNDLLGDRVQL